MFAHGLCKHQVFPPVLSEQKSDDRNKLKSFETTDTVPHVFFYNPLKIKFH